MSGDERMPAAEPARAVPESVPDPSRPETDPPRPAAPAVPASPRPPAAPAPTEQPSPSAATSAAVEPPSPDVALADEASPLPGVHRGGFLRLPTAPIDVTSQSAPVEPGTEEEPAPTAQWLMPPTDAPHRGLAAWALAFSIAGLFVSLFVGWGFPIGLVGLITGILAVRRPLESRQIAVWAIAIGSLSILYSAGWLLFAAAQASIIG